MSNGIYGMAMFLEHRIRIKYLLDDLFILADDEKKPCPVALKLYKMMEEFQTYIRNNEEMIPNYGERWR